MDIKDKISKKLSKTGTKSAFLSIDQSDVIRKKFFDIINSRTYNPEFYGYYLKRFEKDYRQIFPGAKSIIVIVYPQPITEISFTIEDNIIKTIVPPTYIYRQKENMIKAIIENILSEGGFSIMDCPLPEKFTAALSGLARYGRNNICYVEGMGSFFSPLIYLSDFPASKIEIPDTILLSSCKHCTKCISICPTSAISSESFIVNPEKCITYFNENEFEFPDWVIINWQKTLVGCMKCQEVCPANKKVLHNIEKGPDFSYMETEAILKIKDFKGLPDSLKEKIKSLCMEDYYEIIPRNLNMLATLL